MKSKGIILLYGATEIGSSHFSADLLWRTKFRAPDPFFLMEGKDKTYLFASALERNRAMREAEVDAVLPIAKLKDVVTFLKHLKINKIVVPFSFPHGLAKFLARHFLVTINNHLFYPGRFQKTPFEIKEIKKAQAAAEVAFLKARNILQKSKIKEKGIYFGKKLVTSEMLREIIDEDLFAKGFLGIGTIVASGIQAADPHALGRGPVIPHTAIVFDVFPVSRSSHYFADMSRTVFKGRPNDRLIEMYEAVRATQEKSITMVKAGADGARIYNWAKNNFARLGFPTEFKKEKPEGFFHSLGHGVGLDIHEPPNLGSISCRLQKRNVVTVEPGLYYRENRKNISAGGIRIEDMVLVERDSCQNLTKMPKSIAWAVIP